MESTHNSWELLVPARRSPTKEGEYRFLLEPKEGSYQVRLVDLEGKSLSLQRGGRQAYALELYLLASAGRTEDWGLWDEEPGVGLLDRPELTEAILSSGKAVTGKSLKPVNYHPHSRAVPLLTLSESPEEIEARIEFLLPDGKRSPSWQMIGSQTVLIGQEVYPTTLLTAAEHLKAFNCTISDQQRSRFLSVFKSLFPTIEIDYQGYELIQAEPLVLYSAILFEEVAEDGSLYLRIVETHPEDPKRTYETGELTEVLVTVDDETRLLRVQKVISSAAEALADQIEKNLKRLQDKKLEHHGYYREGTLFIIERELTSSLLEKELLGLLGTHSLLGTKNLEKLSLKIANPKLRLDLHSSGIDFLSGSASIMIEEQEYDLSELLKSVERQELLVLHDGSKALIDKRTIGRLQRLLSPREDGQVRLSIYDLPLLEELTEQEHDSPDVRLTREKLIGFSTLSSESAPEPHIEATLRPYQKRGYAWLHYLYSNRMSGILADDMGLGKTVQTLALLNTIAAESEKNILIIMPKSLLWSWIREIETFTPTLDAVTYHGPERDLQSALGHKLILTTYHTVRNDIALLKEVSFQAVILDESQHIKNITSKIFKAVLLLQADWRLALSGTPVENNIYELYALFRFLTPRMFPSLKGFRDQYGETRVRQEPALLEELGRKIYPFLLRRLKQEVLSELPARHEQVLYASMDRAQAELYEARRAFYQQAIAQQLGDSSLADTRFFLFQAFTELRQIASTPQKFSRNIAGSKVKMLCEWVTEAVENDHKVLVFASFLEAVDQITIQLRDQGIEVFTITGSTNDRASIIDEFSHREGPAVLVMTLKTGGVGLNLTAADYVFIFDPWWNQAAEQQAIDRTHRIGQTRAVFSYKLVTKGTIEEKILQLQQNKKELVDALITSDSSAVKHLTEDDIDFILSESRSSI